MLTMDPCVFCVLLFVGSENSSTAVSLFNKAGLVDALLHCLERHHENMELALSAGIHPQV